MYRRSSAILAALAILASGVSLAAAKDRLPVKPGMTLAEASAALKAACPSMTVSGEDEKYLDCARPDGSFEIRATASPAGRIYYVAYSERSAEVEVIAYATAIAQSLGFAGKGRNCRFYGYELMCWTGKDGTTLYSGERDSQQRYVSYLTNEQIETEDMGAPTAAPVTGEDP